MLSYLLLQFVAVIKTSAALIIAGSQLKLQVCHLAKLTLQLAPTSGTSQSLCVQLEGVGSMGTVLAVLALSWGLAVPVQSSLWRGLKADALPGVTCHSGHLPRAIGGHALLQMSLFLPAPCSSPGKEPSTSQLR